MPQDALLDPQGKTVENNTNKLDINNISSIRIGKHITLNVDSDSLDAAEITVKEICNKLLVNQITEQYDYEIQPSS